MLVYQRVNNPQMLGFYGWISHIRHALGADPGRTPRQISAPWNLAVFTGEGTPGGWIVHWRRQSIHPLKNGGFYPTMLIIFSTFIHFDGYFQSLVMEKIVTWPKFFSFVMSEFDFSFLNPKFPLQLLVRRKIQMAIPRRFVDKQLLDVSCNFSIPPSADILWLDE